MPMICMESKGIPLFLCTTLYLLSFVLRNSHSLFSAQPQCHAEERIALLQFKQSFIINKTACADPSANPKLLSWNTSKGGGGENCCFWNGVDCDVGTGHVISLDLGQSCLYGSIDSSSSLFRLLQLQRLNLSYNDFNNSQIPSSIGLLSRLTHLNLSLASVSGQIPAQVLELSRLVSLDLSGNDLAKLQKPGLRSLVEKLTSLEVLYLSYVNISSTVPDTLANLSSLTSLFLRECGLHGHFPTEIFHLPKLKSLSVRFNPNLTGILPEFPKGSPLEKLRLQGTGFSGNLPNSIGNLENLTWLNLAQCSFSGTIPTSLGNLERLTYLSLNSNNFSGSIPTSIGNLKQLTTLDLDENRVSGSIPSSLANLTQLTYLSLSSNNFSGSIPTSIGNLKQLTNLYLDENRLSGSIPSSMANLTQLRYLSLSFNNFNNWTLPAWLGTLSKLTELYLQGTNLNGEISSSSLANLTHLDTLVLYTNQLTGQIPTWIGNFTNLKILKLCENELQGPIPNSIFELLNLETLHFADNSLSGRIEFGKFTKLPKLTDLDLSRNELSVITNTFENGTFPKFSYLGLCSCNLSKFPDFLRSQDELQWLDFSDNKIHGLLPKWVWNICTTSLFVMFLDNNLLSGLEQQSGVLPCNQLNILTLSYNNLQGILPIPPASTKVYKAANNSFYGNLPPFLCNIKSLIHLDLSNNNLSGSIPLCLGTSNMNLSVLNLQGNHFHGAIPQLFRYGSQLRAIYLSRNRLLGKLPRSLANCSVLESLDASQNQINDSFPSWLGVLPNLKILLLGSNQFYGGLGGLGYANEFPSLQILDLSHNDFSGHLPTEFFRNWDAVKRPNRKNFTYMEAPQNIELPGNYSFVYGYKISYAIKVTNKGVETSYWEIQDTLTLIDLSSNRFWGPIPESVGDLSGLKVLNLSHNCLTGLIPQSFGNLTELESLDLSKNSLSGQIPEQLTRLTFLGVFNVSFNNLSGFIPHGKQFDTFQNDSYVANPGLCGNPLSKRCGNYTASSLSSQETPERDEDSRSTIEFDWLVISMGYLSGLIIGWVFGCFLTARRHEWFVDTFGRR